MSDKKDILSERQQEILLALRTGERLALSEIQGRIIKPIPPSTLRRDATGLKEKGLLMATGRGKGVKYTLTPLGTLLKPIDAMNHVQKPIDGRFANTHYAFDLWKTVPSSLFTEKELKQLNEATKKYRSEKHSSPVLAKRELERFVIEFAWKSSKIEGNTYTLLDTEKLIKENKMARGHPKEEAAMILNHKYALDYVLKTEEVWKAPKRSDTQDLHRLLVQDLGVSYGLRKGMVGITGTPYMPLRLTVQIEEALDELLEAVRRMGDPYSKALLVLVGVSYIQPFEDGNKRTGRLSANAILIAHECAPLSYRSVEEEEFKAAMLVFYEHQSVDAMKKIFLAQYLFSAENYRLL